MWAVSPGKTCADVDAESVRTWTRNGRSAPVSATSFSRIGPGRVTSTCSAWPWPRAGIHHVDGSPSTSDVTEWAGCVPPKL